MDLWQMRYFIQIYQDKSFSKAARNLYITQQALSKTMKNIETELQLPLFERMASGLKPTTYADFLFEKACRIVNDYDNMMEDLNIQARNTNMMLSIGMANILFTNDLKMISSNFQAEHSNIILEFFEYGYYTCEKHLNDNLIDICFSIKPDDKSKYTFIPITKYNLILLINKEHSLSTKSVINLLDLRNERFIMFPTDSKIRKIIIDNCLKLGFHPNIVVTASQLDFIIELIDLNNGIAILPECIYFDAIKMSNNIVALTFDDLALQIETGFIIQKNRKNKNITKTFIEYFKEHIKN